MGFVNRRESFRFGLLAGSDWHLLIVGFKGEGSGHALGDLLLVQKRVDKCNELAWIDVVSWLGCQSLFCKEHDE